MAGGTWMSQNKVQPGVYINNRSPEETFRQISEKRGS